MIEDIGDVRRGSYGRHHGLRRPGALPFPHLTEQVRQIAVIGNGGVMILARHLARALDAGLLGLGPAERADAFQADGKAAQICPVRWRALRGEPTIDDLQAANFVVTDSPARAEHLSLLCPTLFSQPTPRTGSIGTNILIVWDGSNGAARAVRAVRPLLRDARHVHITAVGVADPAIVVEILEEHGILASTMTVPDDAAELAARVIEQVDAYGIDLLVSGRMNHGCRPVWSHPLPYPACAWFTA